MTELPPPEVLASGKYLRLIAQGHWEFAERVNATGAVVVVAITDERRVILVEQFRIPVRCKVIEMPAGLVGDVPQDALAARKSRGQSDAAAEMAETARRELIEETGYEASDVRLLGGGPVSAGLSNEIISFFSATGLRRVHGGGGVDHEEITVHEIPLEQLDSWLAQRSSEGLMIDPKIFAGLWMLQQAETE